MVETITCQLSKTGDHEFYLRTSRNTYFLFSQKYRKSVHLFYSDGVWLNEALDFGKSRRDHAIVHTMRKLPIYIRYVEKENGISVLNRTKSSLVKHENKEIYSAKQLNERKLYYEKSYNL